MTAHPSQIWCRSSFQPEWRIKRQRSHFKQETQRPRWIRCRFEIIVQNNKRQPTTTEHLFLKNPLEIDFFLQVAQFVLEVLGEILQYFNIRGWVGVGAMARTNEGTATSLFLCASEYFYTQSDPAVPRPGEDPDESGVDGRVYHVLSVCVVVKVPLKHLHKTNSMWKCLLLQFFHLRASALVSLSPRKNNDVKTH